MLKLIFLVSPINSCKSAAFNHPWGVSAFVVGDADPTHEQFAEVNPGSARGVLVSIARLRADVNGADGPLHLQCRGWGDCHTAAIGNHVHGLYRAAKLNSLDVCASISRVS